MPHILHIILIIILFVVKHHDPYGQLSSKAIRCHSNLVLGVLKMKNVCLIYRSSSNGFQLWLEANKESLEEEHPDKEDITAIAEDTFKNLSADELQVTEIIMHD